MSYDTITVEVRQQVAHVALNRPDKANSLNEAMWQELQQAMEWCDAEPQVRAVVLSGNGKHFCAGIDLAMLMNMQRTIEDSCEARKRDKLRRLIVGLQANVSSLELCRKPVIAAIHGACVGGALDIVLAADIRLAAEGAVFSVREVDVGMVADVGSLQRLARVVGEGNARELALTARDVPADLEAPEGRAFEPKQALLFVALLATVMLVSAWLQAWLGEVALDAVMAVSGLADAHEVAASAAQLVATGRIEAEVALTGIALGLTTNSATKVGLAWASGGRAYALRLLPGIVAMLLAFVLTLRLL